MNSVKSIPAEQLPPIPISASSPSSNISVSKDTSDSETFNNLLKTLLVLDIVILDKLHRRSNLSLILIHLRCSLDDFIDKNQSQSANITHSIELVISEFNDSISIVFENSKYFNISDLHSIYEDFYNSISSSTPISSIDFNSVINSILCCSESLADFKHFNRSFDESKILDYDLQKLKSHYINTSFNRRGNTPTTQQINHITNENLVIVQSKSFMDFHLKRWKTLNLLDRHIFKNKISKSLGVTTPSSTSISSSSNQ